MKFSRNLDEIEYDLELERVAKEISRQKAKKVLIQLPDGLKPFATEIAEALGKKAKAKDSEILIWMGSCYGACDVPSAESEVLGIDLIVQFGHSAWDFKGKKGIKLVK
jgi:2-(3-amino-3-carboxypropyl)histidine synthase